MKTSLRDLVTGKRIMFLALFSVLVLIAKQINFSSIIGAEQQYFTLFQFFGPIAGSFLGPFIGAGAVLIAQLSDMLLFGKTFDFINIFRLTPMLFAAAYFGLQSKKKFNFSAVIPLIAMALFILHPVGRTVWFYSLYWLIPVIATVFFKNNLFFRSLGSTFTAHSIGSIIFLYTIPMPAEAWLALIPIVAVERLAFAFGISISFVAFTTVLAKLENFIPSNVLLIDKKYALQNMLSR
ncbi:hypothetical protein KKG83_01960 [Candidatus Micrarchaeota archaeon]|nr:hypothetical protein [Candidatus Micrarchaeota archaeon]MBU2476215.1 hypothetical protein [Candidatus Micrarchaeota archaeon]